jgi:hypothetical protein
MAHQFVSRDVRSLLGRTFTPLLAQKGLLDATTFSTDAVAACTSHGGRGDVVPNRLSAADYASYLSTAAAARKPSAIRALMPLLQVPGMISLGGGMPNPETFPFKKLTVRRRSLLR